MRRKPILSVASEIFPLIKTGGLADVVGALPGALRAEGFALHTLVPGYPAVMAALEAAATVHVYPDLIGVEARLLAGRAGDLDLFVLDAPHLYGRSGNPYQQADGTDWPDNALRFGALGRVAADLATGLLPTFTPKVVHCHDWQAGLAPAYLAYSGKRHPPAVMTVHNLAFQGTFPPELLATLGLPERAMTLDGIEYHGQIGFLKAGLRHADRITTVSPTYAGEICSDEFGMGLQGLLRGRSNLLRGILNGIDVEVWNPRTDPSIAATYQTNDLAPRGGNKRALQARTGLAEDAAAPLFAVVSRLSWQKGLDLLLAAVPVLLEEGAQLCLLGAGDPELETAFRAAAAMHPQRVGCVIGYDEALAHLIQAGSDALLVPSRFEPCGLTQLCALRYGAVPVVSRVGGLADTVVDANPVALASGAGTGVMFAAGNVAVLESAIRRTIRLYREPEAWSLIQRNGMHTDVSWASPAREYAALFGELIPVRRTAASKG